MLFDIIISTLLNKRINNFYNSKRIHEVFNKFPRWCQYWYWFGMNGRNANVEGMPIHQSKSSKKEI